MTNDRDTPWLQDEEAVEAWDLWQVNYRDVFVLDGDQNLAAKLSLTELDLTETENYEYLKDLLLSTD